MDSFPLSTIQDLYYRATGKTEKLRYLDSKCYVFNEEDFRQLKHHMSNHLERYKILKPSIEIVIYYSDEFKMVNTSWDQFFSKIQSKSESIEKISIKYEFVHVHPESSEILVAPEEVIDRDRNIYQRYAVEISIISKASSSIRSLAKFLKSISGNVPSMVVEVEHVNHEIANDIINCVKRWSGNLDVTYNRYHSKFLQKISQHFEFYFMHVASIVSIIPAYYSIEFFKENNILTADSLALWMIFFACIIFSMRMMGKLLGDLLENSIDRTSEISFINITKGDQKIVNEMIKNNKNSMIKALLIFLAFVSQITCGVFANLLMPLFR